MRNIIDYIEEPRFKSLMLELSKSNGEEDVNEIIRRYKMPMAIWLTRKRNYMVPLSPLT